MTQEHLLYEVDNLIATITVNRPERRNSFTWEMWDRLKDLAYRAQADPAVRVVVIRGAGEKSFASGADIAEMAAESDPNRLRAGRQRLSDAVDALEGLDKPVIAEIRGYALGGGVELALACDLRYASSEAVFGIPPAKLGLVLTLGYHHRLITLIGAGRTRELLYTARTVDAREAAAIGLIHECVPGEKLGERVQEVAAQICACSPTAVAGAKRSIGYCLKTEDVDPELFSMQSFSSPDFREGVRAFLEKRKPSWPGSGSA